MNIDWVDPFKFTDPDEMFEERVRTLTTDIYFMSSNAVTMDGILVNIDGTGNRVAALCYGPKKVVLVVGANKIVGSEEEAVARIKTDACPPNCIRLGKKTPCATTGKCGNCLSQGNTICSYTVSTRFCSTGRIHVILVNDYLGY
ncbi:MAG: lactate utilization protein, partial [Anaerovoracaceae bacterium]|nr:lactate utilization protein [Anaerovoracaceae bacterium]